MSTPNFRFKQFTVWHDLCAMKVGTDGVLLGAWTLRQLASLPPTPYTILDIGTGSGLIALMLAQGLPDAIIDAIDIDRDAAEQAAYNFAQSPWSDRLRAVHTPLSQHMGQYGLIVSNPPYFVDSMKNPDKGRELARHTDTLPYAELMRDAARLLTDGGHLCLILPAEAEQEIMNLGASHGLYPVSLTRVYSKPGKPCKRVMVAFRRECEMARGRSGEMARGREDILYIESAYSPRSEEYAELTKDFYL